MEKTESEKERMLAGEPYRSRDPELLALYHRAQNLLGEFRSAESTELQKKRSVLSALLGRIDDDVWIEAPFFCDYGENIHIGRGVFVNYNCVFLDSNKITIGSDTLIGPGVQIYTAGHPLDAGERVRYESETTPSYYVTRAMPVNIGDRAWIGGGAIVMPGVSIGDNTTIGAGSIVTKSVPANCFAAGNPCAVIRRLVEDV